MAEEGKRNIDFKLSVALTTNQIHESTIQSNEMKRALSKRALENDSHSLLLALNEKEIGN
uniref:Uncharacterized protein n=1 Tax=Strigamia maritima TaxID=126957 RepID=T1JDH7_STRMM